MYDDYPSFLPPLEILRLGDDRFDGPLCFGLERCLGHPLFTPVMMEACIRLHIKPVTYLVGRVYVGQT